MYFAEFYQMSTGYVAGSIPPRFDDARKKPIPASGDRSVVILDGRQHAGARHQIAAEECRRRGFIGYKLHKGESFTRVTNSTGFYPVKA